MNREYEILRGQIADCENAERYFEASEILIDGFLENDFQRILSGAETEELRDIKMRVLDKLYSDETIPFETKIGMGQILDHRYRKDELVGAIEKAEEEAGRLQEAVA